jgi:hypothetical protein
MLIFPWQRLVVHLAARATMRSRRAFQRVSQNCRRDLRGKRMGEDQPKQRSQADADLEREIRDGRKFSLAEAIGRLAGPGIMKGVSPITQKEQAGSQIESYLDHQLIDAVGAMRAVLLRQVQESELLDEHFEQPLIALGSYVKRILDSDYLLQELVRESDVEWGRVFGERPYFEKEGCSPHQDDPYTVESVRTRLSQLLEKLTAGHE